MIAHRHAGVLARFEDVEVRAIVDPVLERAEELADHVSVAAYRSYLDMLDAEDLDAVYGGAPAELSDGQHPSGSGRTVGCVR